MAEQIEIESRVLISPAFESKNKMADITRKKVEQISEMYKEPKIINFATIFLRKDNSKKPYRPKQRIRYYPARNIYVTTSKILLDSENSEVKKESEYEYKYDKDAFKNLIQKYLDEGYGYYAHTETTRYKWKHRGVSIELSNHFPFSVQIEFEKLLDTADENKIDKESEMLKSRALEFVKSMGGEILEGDKYEKIWKDFWNDNLIEVSDVDEVAGVFEDLPCWST